jgi:hypothetical protein
MYDVAAERIAVLVGMRASGAMSPVVRILVVIHYVFLVDVFFVGSLDAHGATGVMAISPVAE